MSRATAAYDRAASSVRRRRPPQASGLDHRELVRQATLAPSSHNTQPWRFRLVDGSIAVLPDLDRRCPVVDPDDAHLFKSLGCAVENLVQAAAAQGHAADVTFDAGEQAVVTHIEPSPGVRPTELFDAIPLRQCTRTPYDGTSLTVAELNALETAGTGPGVRTVLLTARAELDAVTEYVTRGNQEQLQDRAFRRELASWIRFNPRQALRAGDGLAGRTTGRPSIPAPVGKVLLPFVLTGDGQAATDAAHLASSTAVAVFVATGDGPAAWVEVGRAYQRFALKATVLEIRTAFVNQPVEVQALRSPFETWLGLDGESATLVVRMGHAPLAPFSLRRPVSDVLLRQPEAQAAG